MFENCQYLVAIANWLWSPKVTRVYNVCVRVLEYRKNDLIQVGLYMC